MKKIIIFSLLICLLIPFFSINVSAAEYDLCSPTVWGSFNVNSSSRTAYCYKLVDGEYTPFSRSWAMYFYENGYDAVGFFDEDFTWSINKNSPSSSIASYDFASYKTRAADIDISKNVLAFTNRGDLRETLWFPAISYNNIYFPSSSQVMKVEFTVDTVKLGTSLGIPSVFDDLLKPEYLCFFELDSAEMSGAPLTVPFSSVVVTPSNNGRVLKYTYYFNAYGEVFNVLEQNSAGSLLRLVIRMPYYFGNSSLLTDGAFVLTNADFPTIYEIITVGGYSQELKGIENAIVKSNEELLDYYNEVSESDQALIIHQQEQNNVLDDTINDYNDAQNRVEELVTDLTVPTLDTESYLNALEIMALGPFANLDFIWTDTILVMLSTVFTLAIISLILFGKKA